MEDFFSQAFQKEPLLTLAALASLLGLIVSVCLLYSLIRYERYACESRRTLVTRMVSQLSWSVIEYLVAIVGSDLLRYFYGPLPRHVCLVKTMMTASMALQIMLFVSAVVATRYSFIFILNNPASVLDTFWVVFSNLWIRLFVLITQTAAILMPGAELAIFYLCSGERPRPFDPTSFKLSNLQVIIFCLCLVNSPLMVRIQWRKLARPLSNAVVAFETFASDARNLHVLVTAALETLFFIFTALWLRFFNTVDPRSLNRFPNNVLLHFFRFVWPQIAALVIFLTALVKQHHFRKFWIKSVKMLFENFILSVSRNLLGLGRPAPPSGKAEK